MIENEIPPEVWKDIKGYEGFYQVSNKGNVKSLERTEKTNNKWGEMYRTRKEFVMKLTPYPNGHLGVELNKNGEKKRISVHRLVYETFIGSLEENKCVHHIDFNKKNNIISNLEQVTYLEHNNIHSHEAWNKNKKWSKEHLNNIIEARRKSAKKKFEETFLLWQKGARAKDIAQSMGICTRSVYERIKRYKELENVN